MFIHFVIFGKSLLRYFEDRLVSAKRKGRAGTRSAKLSLPQFYIDPSLYLTPLGWVSKPAWPRVLATGKRVCCGSNRKVTSEGSWQRAEDESTHQQGQAAPMLVGNIIVRERAA